MSSNISEFLGIASNQYLPTRFTLQIDNLAETVLSKGSTSIGLTKSMLFQVDSVFFPGRALGSDTFKIAGPVDEIPYESVYSGDLDITMRVSKDLKEKMLFESWMDMVVNQKTQNLSYPDSYRCDATIRALLPNDEIAYEMRLIGAWPKTTGRISVGHNLTNTISTMQISLAWRRYYVTYTKNVQYLGNESNNNIRDKIQTARQKAGAWYNTPQETADTKKAIDSVKNGAKNLLDMFTDSNNYKFRKPTVGVDQIPTNNNLA